MIIDNREPDYIKDKLAKFGNIETLEVGDYIVHNKIIERKTAGDLISSIIDKRIWDQLSSMKYNKEFDPILIITGNIWKALSGTRIRNKSNFYYGAMYGITKYNIPMLYFYDDDEFIEFIKYVDKKTDALIDTPDILPIKKNKDINMLMRSSLCCVPSISAKKASLLLDNFKTLRNISNANVEELSKVLGDKSSNEVYNFYNRSYDYE